MMLTMVGALEWSFAGHHAYREAESTVITLSDWYHTASKLGTAFP